MHHISAVNSTDAPTSSQASWVVHVRNNSGFRSFNNLWLAKSGGSAPNDEITSVQRITSAQNKTPINGPAEMQGGVFQLDNIGPGSSHYYLVTATYERCGEGYMELSYSNDCLGYPESLEDASCVSTNPVKLVYKPIEGLLQTSFQKRPTAENKAALCEPMEFVVELNNAGGEAKEIQFTIPLSDLPGLSYTPGAVAVSPIYTQANANPDFTPLQDDDLVSIYNVETTVVKIDNGVLTISLPESAVPSLKKGERVYVKFAVATADCDFVSGDVLTITPAGRNFCGSPISANRLLPLFSNRIILKGAPEDEPIVGLTSSVEINIIQAGELLTASYNATIKNIGSTYNNYPITGEAALSEDPATHVYRYAIKLPVDWVLADPQAFFAAESQALYDEYDQSKGYIFNFNESLEKGEEIHIENVQLIYTGDVENLDCEENFGDIRQEVFTMFTPESTCVPELKCESELLVVEHRVDFKLIGAEAPKGLAKQVFCEDTDPTLADIVLNDAGILVWYAEATGTTELPVTTPLVDGTTYYVANRLMDNSACLSSRFEVAVQVDEKPLADAGEDKNSYDSGLFMMTAEKPVSGHTGLWTVVSVEPANAVVYIEAPTLYRTNVTIPDGTTVQLKWTVTNGTCADESTVSLSFNRIVDLALTKQADKDHYIVGDEVVYTIRVSNMGEGKLFADDVIEIEEDLPAGLTSVVYGASSMLGVVDATTGAFTLTADLEKDDYFEITVTASIDKAFRGASLENRATVSVPSGVQDDDPTNNSDNSIINVSRVVDLAASKVADKERVIAGDELTYTIVVRNDGPATLLEGEKLKLEDVFPDDVFETYTFHSASGTYDHDAGVFTLIEDLITGDEFVLTMEAKVLATARVQDVANTVVVEAPTGVTDNDPTNNEADFTVEIVREVDLLVKKEANKLEVLAGEMLTYTITVTNQGISTLLTGETIALVEQLPTELEVEDIQTTGGVYDAEAHSFTLTDDLPAGESVQLIVRARVAADATVTAVTNKVSVTTPNDVTDPEEDDNEATVTTPVKRVADLEVEKTADKETVMAGEDIEYNIIVTNNGPSTLLSGEMIGLIEDLPNGLTLRGYETTGGVYDAEAGTFELTDNLVAGSFVRLVVKGNIDADATVTELRNKVRVSTPADVSDPDLDNNEDATSVDVQRVVDLAVEKLIDKEVAVAGDVAQEINYTITILNNGVSTLLGGEVIGLEEYLPTGLSVLGFKAKGGVYDMDNSSFTLTDNMVSGASVELSVKATINADVNSGTLVNTVRVSTPTGVNDPDLENNEASATIDVQRVVDLAVSKTADKTQLIAGDDTDLVQYTITLVNNGPSTLSSGELIRLLETIPEGLSVVGFETRGGIYDIDNSSFTLTDNMVSGASVELLLKAIVNADVTSESLLNVVRVSTPTSVSDPDLENNEASASINVQRVVDLKVNKKADKEIAVAGEEIEYTILVTNNGPSALVAGELLDLAEKLPAELDDVRYQAKGGDYLAGSGLFKLSTGLPAQSSVALTVQGQLKASAAEGSEMINTVELDAPKGVKDPDYSNNDDQVVVPVIRRSDLSIEKTVSETAPIIGLETTFTITVTNIGPSDATYVTVLEPLNSGYEYMRSEATAGSYAEDDGLWSVGDMVAGQTEQLQLTVKVLKEGEYLNTVTVEATEKDPHPDNNETSVEPEPVAAPPVARDDRAETKSNNSVDIAVLDNDEPGESLSPLVPSSVQIVSQPKNGALEVDEDGIAVYTPEHGYVGQDEFTYRVQDKLGFWSNEAVVIIDVIANEVYIPNVFTPNGDGKNDVFEINGLENFDKLELLVVNRFGNEVYQNTDYKNTWTGSGLNEGTYYYIITTHKGADTKQIKGWVLIKSL